jgi:hypothetical protein
MTKRTADFLVSTGPPDEQYGLYVMDHNCVHHTEEFALTYLVDSDDLKGLPRATLGSFVAPADLASCKDEYGDVYTGTALASQIREVVRAYRESCPATSGQ